MAWRTEFLKSTRTELAEAEDRLVRGDYQIDPSDELAALVGATTETQREGLAAKVANLKSAIARAEACTDAEFGESWQR